MSPFVASQMDYIYFIYGAAFLLLVPVCLFLKRRSYSDLAWIWLGCFGAIHGVNEWLDLASLYVDSGPVFDLTRLFLLIVSFACLLEFGRSSTAAIRGHGPGPWILALLVGPVALGGLAGPAGLIAATRYILGLVGGFWAAAALFLAAQTSTSGSRSLRTTALGMASYALATGLVVNPAPFFPASWLNSDSFAAVTSIPIQVVRGFLAVWICFFLCLFAQACLVAEKNHHLWAWFRNLLRGAMAGVILILAVGWFYTQHLGDIATKDEREDFQHEVVVLQQMMRNHMEDSDHLVKIMSMSPEILPALTHGNPQTLQQANAVLDRFSQTLPGSVCYLMNLQGAAISSSNRDRPDSFVGQAYAFRPYFQKALLESSGGYWALGITSKELGYYASQAVRDQSGRIVGVAVIKKTISEMVKVVRENYLGLVLDPHGIIVLANHPELILRSLWPLPAEAKEQLLASRQFGDGPFTPILERQPQEWGEVRLWGKRRLVLRQPLTWGGWSMVIMGSVRSIVQARFLGISVTLLFCLALAGFMSVIVIIRESEERFRQLFDSAADILILHDRGKIIEVNQQACLSLGYTREELLQMSIFDIEVGRTRESLYGLWERTGHAATALSGIHRRKDGSTFPVELRIGEIIFRRQKLRLAAIRDVTERRQTEEALRAERQRLFNLLDGLRAHIFLRRLDYEVVYANQAFRELFGDPVGRPCYAVLHGRQQPCDYCPSAAIFDTGKPQEWEWTSGSGRSYQLYAYPFADADGTPLALEMGIDITARKQAEEAVRLSRGIYQNLASQLLTAQEDERKRLARELHDDLTQRLAVLAIEIEMLAQRLKPSQEPIAVKLMDLKSKLVDLSIDTHAISRRLHPSILDDLGLADAIDSECQGFMQREGIAVNYQSEDIPREMPQDVSLIIYRTVQEGLRNISRHAQATKVDISLGLRNGAIHLTIKDNGKGFDLEQIKGKGGLGLSSMKERTYLNDGAFALRSRPGEGTVIEVLLPLSGGTV